MATKMLTCLSLTGGAALENLYRHIGAANIGDWFFFFGQRTMVIDVGVLLPCLVDCFGIHVEVMSLCLFVFSVFCDSWLCASLVYR